MRMRKRLSLKQNIVSWSRWQILFWEVCMRPVMVEQRMVLTMSCERVDNIRDRKDAAAFNSGR
eukprot:scaffold21941_cov117-Skeletonema_marinoi.AAC.1